MAEKKKRKSGIPTGNAGEYLVMGELLRRGFDAQLADRNTKGYDLTAGLPDSASHRKIQVKTVRLAPWFVRKSSFEGRELNEITIYVLLGTEKSDHAVRFFIAANRELVDRVHYPAMWDKQGFMPFKAIEAFENRWEWLRSELRTGVGSSRSGGEA